MGFVRLAGHAVATVEANFLQPPSARREGWEFLGARGAASLAPLRLWLDDGDAWADRTPPPGALAPSREQPPRQGSHCSRKEGDKTTTALDPIP